MKIIIPVLLALCSLQASSSEILDKMLVEQNYLSFENSLKKIYPEPLKQKEYLMKQVYTGHPIVYWILAGNFSREIVAEKYVYTNQDNIDFTKHMVYIALLLTEQDTLSCMETDIRGVSQEYLHKYPTILDFERKYPYNNSKIFEKSVTFTQTIRSRPSAKWICLEYGNERNVNNYGKLWGAEQVERIRKETTEELRRKIK